MQKGELRYNYLNFFKRYPMKKLLLLILTLATYLMANECSPYYNPKKFYETPEILTEILDEHFPNGIFSNKEFKNETLINGEVLKKDSFVKQGEYIYPTKTTVWKYRKVNDRVDEVNFSRTEIYRFSDLDIANTVNDDFENFWNDYIEDAYEMQLTPEQTLFRYNNTYFTMSVFIYGVLGDSTPLKGTVVNLWLKDYTKEVNTHIQCMKEKNDS